MHNKIEMRKKLTIYFLALFGLVILLNSCKKEYETIESIDDAKIQAYLKKNNLNMTKDPSGFYYQVLSNGTGVPFVNKDSIFYTLNVSNLEGVNYYNTSTYSNEGTYFGYLNPSSYRTALAGTNRGAKVRVILPSYLAYGRNGSGNVPPNEIIISELTTKSEKSQIEIDDKIIVAFLAANNITATKAPSRVYYKINTLGQGNTIGLSSSVTVKYTGRLLNGTVFDQTTGDNTLTYAVDQVIRGWDVLLGMSAGTKVRIFVPSDLAYGPSGSGTAVPPSAILDFDIEIVSVTN